MDRTMEAALRNELRDALPSERRLLDFRDLTVAIDSEYTLNDGRNNFMLFLHTVLFGVLGVLIARDKPITFHDVAIDWLAIAGVASAFASGLSVFAGVCQIHRLKKIRQASFPDLIDTIQFKVGASTGSLLHALGILPYVFYAPILTVAWLMIYSFQ